MRYSIFTIYLISRYKSILLWSISMALLAIMFTALYEPFAGAVEGMAEIAPAEMEAIWGGNLEYASTPAGWLGIELYGIFLPIVLAIIAVNSGSTAIGGEEDSGTLELLLASPISRSRIVVEKSLSIITQIGLVAISVWGGVALGSFLFSFKVSLLDVLLATIMAWLFGTSISYLSLCVHSITGSKGLAIGIGSLFVGLSYIANVLAQLLNSLSGLKYFSTFYYYSGGTVLVEGLSTTNFLVLAGASVILWILSVRFFETRDTGV